MTVSEISQDHPLILASASPRRRLLLDRVGLPFRVVPSGVEEGRGAGEPDALAVTLSREKAWEVVRRVEGHWILGADTLVVAGERILGKPKDPREARDMLRLLSGREHRVVTGFTILDPNGAERVCTAVSTWVRFKILDPSEVEGYVASGEPFGKAGAYAIQGIGAFMVESIKGSYTNVVGLPVCAVVRALRSAGALRSFPLPRRRG